MVADILIFDLCQKFMHLCNSPNCSYFSLLLLLSSSSSS